MSERAKTLKPKPKTKTEKRNPKVKTNGQYEVYVGSPPTKVNFKGGYWVPASLPMPLSDAEATVQALNARPRPPKRDEVYFDSLGRLVIHVSTLKQAKERYIPDISGTSKVVEVCSGQVVDF